MNINPAYTPSNTNAVLDSVLKPFQSLIDDPEVVEISVNRPGEVWVERRGSTVMTKSQSSSFSDVDIARFSRQCAQIQHQYVDEKTPLLSAALPTGERIQFVLQPASRHGCAFSLRKQSTVDFSLDDLKTMGAMNKINMVHDEKKENAFARVLTSLAGKKTVTPDEAHNFITTAVQLKKNIIFSGGTSTGKTTWLNAALKAAGEHERIITIEDTPELKPPQENTLSLLASKGEQSHTQVTIQNLLEASLRLRPDRIMVGELRGPEAYTFLRAVNTGHPGSISTIHANSPEGAMEQLCIMVMGTFPNFSQKQLFHYISSVVDVIIQLKKTDNYRGISQIWAPRYASND